MPSRSSTAVRAEMVRLARDLWPAWCPTRPIPDEDQALVRGVLDAVAVEHPAADDKLDYCRAEHRRIEAFCREIDLIGLSEEPLEIRWTPVFLRAFGGAMLIAPGPLEHGQASYFAITPAPDDWTAEQRESALREDNDRMLRLLTIHEAVPGHYLQGAYANRCPSLPRAVFHSGLFAEGWAVYVTQVMMDVGYGADDPALLLTHWKYYLRCVINAIIDARIHCRRHDRGRGRGAHGGRRVPGGVRGPREVFAGTTLVDPALDVLRGLVRAVGHGARDAPPRAGDPAIQARALPGGFGATPGFVYRDHLESVIAHGSPPTALLRRILLG